MVRVIRVAVSLVYILTLAAPCWAQSSTQSPEPTPAPAPAATAAPTIPAAPLSLDCHEQGTTQGGQASTGGAFAIGLVSGGLLGLIGTGIAYFCQGKPDAPAQETSKISEAACREEFREAYGKKGQSKKKSAALIGGLIGTGIGVAIIMSQNSSSTE